MKKKTLLASTVLAGLVVAGAAQAADLAPSYKAPPPPPPVFSWTGFYIGVHGGAGWGTTEWRDAVFSDGTTLSGTLFSYNKNGFLAGGQIGYNWQTGPIVFGIEADGGWADIKGGNFGFNSKIDALGTITARLGFTVDRALIYVEGGAAIASVKHSIGTGGINFGFDGFGISDSHTRWGAVLGTGIEYAFLPNWTAKVEYNFIDFEGKDVNFVSSFDPTLSANFDVKQSIHTIKFGINYKFGPGGVVARY